MGAGGRRWYWGGIVWGGLIGGMGSGCGTGKTGTV